MELVEKVKVIFLSCFSPFAVPKHRKWSREGPGFCRLVCCSVICCFFGAKVMKRCEQWEMLPICSCADAQKGAAASSSGTEPLDIARYQERLRALRELHGFQSNTKVLFSFHFFLLRFQTWWARWKCLVSWWPKIIATLGKEKSVAEEVCSQLA